MVRFVAVVRKRHGPDRASCATKSFVQIVQSHIPEAVMTALGCVCMTLPLRRGCTVGYVLHQTPMPEQYASCAAWQLLRLILSRSPRSALWRSQLQPRRIGQECPRPRTTCSGARVVLSRYLRTLSSAGIVAPGKGSSLTGRLIQMLRQGHCLLLRLRRRSSRKSRRTWGRHLKHRRKPQQGSIPAFQLL